MQVIDHSNHSQEMESNTERDGGPVSSGRGKLLRCLGFGLLLSSFYCVSLIRVEETALATSSSGSNSVSNSASNSGSNIISYDKVTFKGIPDLSSFENCAISFVKPKHLNTSAKPLLFPSTSGFSFQFRQNTDYRSGFYYHTVIDLLTGGLPSLRWGNSRTGQHCNARPGAVAACVNALMGVKKDQFDSRVLLGIRNPLTAFPANINERVHKYHDPTPGQVPENVWRRWRNNALDVTIDGWMDHIRNWGNMSHYYVETYVTYEHWLDPDRGPAVIQKIADTLRGAGFSVAPPEDFPCIWYHSIGDKYVFDKEFFKYVPGYTVEQRDSVLAKLQIFMEEMADNPVFLPVLKEYYADIQDNTRIDNGTQVA